MTEEVKLTASLAKLRLSEDELNAYTAEIERVFELLEPIRSSDAECEPLIFGYEGVRCALREDVLGEGFDRSALLNAAPDVQENCYAVPRILE